MQRNQLRIIGGEFRSRKLEFPDVEGLRPTGDRIRETLFNWLAAHVSGARCLDLFAGSGALGLEALSRGAEHVVFVDQSTLACEKLRQNLALLKISHAEVLCMNSLTALNILQGPFDILFLDPPFSSELVAPTCEAIEEQRLLIPGSLIYLEQATTSPPIAVPPRWQKHRDKSGGQVRYQLYHYI